MMSVEMQKVHDFAKNMNDSLLATDPRFQSVVHAIHEEGTTLFFKSAFCVNFKDEKHNDWVLIFTEHHNFFVYAKNDLVEYNQYVRTNIGLIVPDGYF